MAQYTKKFTEMVGMAVAKTPRQSLTELYSQTLTVLGAMPTTSAYRQQTELLTTERLNMVKAEENVNVLEKQINCGQIEEVIIQAKDELKLAENLIECQPWENQETQAPHGQWS